MTNEKIQRLIRGCQDDTVVGLELLADEVEKYGIKDYRTAGYKVLYPNTSEIHGNEIFMLDYSLDFYAQNLNGMIVVFRGDFCLNLGAEYVVYAKKGWGHFKIMKEFI